MFAYAIDRIDACYVQVKNVDCKALTRVEASAKSQERRRPRLKAHKVGGH